MCISVDNNSAAGTPQLSQGNKEIPGVGRVPTDIPGKAFAKVSADLIVELPSSHYNNKNVLVMVDHLTGLPIA